MTSVSTDEIPNDPLALKSLCLELLAENDRLNAMLRLSRHRQFGSSSEAMLHPGVQPLFPDLDKKKDEGKEDERPDVQVKAHKKKVGRKPFPKELPRVDITLDVDDKSCSCCGAEDNLKKVSEETSEKLHSEPAKVCIQRYIRPVYSCRKCESMKTAPMPPHPIPKCSVTPETIAQIAVSKYMDSLPLYRQEQIFQRSGVEVARENMARWMVQIAEQLAPLKRALHK